jgi:hypothetical protein
MNEFLNLFKKTKIIEDHIELQVINWLYYFLIQ